MIEQIWAPKFTYLDNLKKRVLMNVHSILYRKNNASVEQVHLLYSSWLKMAAPQIEVVKGNVPICSLGTVYLLGH